MKDSLLGIIRQDSFGNHNHKKSLKFLMIPLIRTTPGHGGAGNFSEFVALLKHGKSPVIGGDSACPPEPPLRCAMMVHYLLWSNALYGVPQRRWRRRAVASKSVEKNSMRLPMEPILFLIRRGGVPPVAAAFIAY